MCCMFKVGFKEIDFTFARSNVTFSDCSFNWLVNVFGEFVQGEGVTILTSIFGFPCLCVLIRFLKTGGLALSVKINLVLPGGIKQLLLRRYFTYTL